MLLFCPCSPQMLKSEDQGAVKVVLEVCQMMVDCLVENVLTLDENAGRRK